ncbi:MAG: hypothetical protein WC662_00250 [Candidatus Paceibacterota bacterium]|jgi:hypothetical protein
MKPEVVIKKSKRKIILTITIVIILIFVVFLYPYFSNTQFRRTIKQKLQGKYISENYTCVFKGETVYLKTKSESGVADGFQGMTLYDKNHKEIDSGTSGGFSGITVWKNNIGFDGTNCKKN